MSGKITIRDYASPVGDMVVGAYGDKICLCDWTASKRHAANLLRVGKLLDASYHTGFHPLIERAILQLNEYFMGARTYFDLPLLFSGTEFQRNVWEALRQIPYGTTISYRQLASLIGNIRAVRAVAAANAANPISIIVPCHRVIGANNTLTGYAGGLNAKAYLLSLEYATVLK